MVLIDFFETAWTIVQHFNRFLEKAWTYRFLEKTMDYSAGFDQFFEKKHEL